MNSGFPWITAIGVLPLVGAVVTLAVPTVLPAVRARTIALLFSLVTLGLVIAMALQFDVADAGAYQFAERHAWIPQFGASYAVGVDGIALTMVALSAILVPVCVLAAWNQFDVVPVSGPPVVVGADVVGADDAGHDIAGAPGAAEASLAPSDVSVDARSKHFFALILILETFMIGVFAARDVFLFYVIFEAMLIPVYFLIGVFGGPQRRYAAVKFLLYSLLGGLVMLVAVIGLYAVGPGGEQGFLTENLLGLDFSSATVERLLFAGFFFAFAVKAPMWPLHTWLPDAAAEAPPAVSVLLVGVLDKVGTFGMLTLCLPLFPEASRWAAPTVVVVAVISVIYGGLVAIGQRDILRLIAYTSISHFGFIVLGVFAMTTTSQNGSTLYMLNHGFSTAALFLIAGMVIKRGGSSQIADYGGLQRVTPLLAGVFLIAGLSALSLPGLSSFISEILVIVGSYQRYAAASVIATLGIVIAAIYVLLTYQRIFTGPIRESFARWSDLNVREAWVVAPLLAVILALGFYPKPVLDVLQPAVSRTMEQSGASDPQPSDPAVAEAETGADK
jgi:NADH-quinone oxidoreductase subunit M